MSHLMARLSAIGLEIYLAHKLDPYLVIQLEDILEMCYLLFYLSLVGTSIVNPPVYEASTGTILGILSGALLEKHMGPPLVYSLGISLVMSLGTEIVAPLG